MPSIVTAPNNGQYPSTFGIEVVGYEVLPLVGFVDSSTELMRLERKGMDFLLVDHFGGGLAVVIQDADRLGLVAEGVRPVSATGSLDSGMVDRTGSSSEGWWTFYGGILPTEESTPAGMEMILEMGREYRGWDSPEEVSPLYSSSMTLSLVAVEGLRIAIENVGLENLDGRAVRDALSSIEDFDTGGLTLPINMSDERPFVLPASRMMEIQGGEMVPISGWIGLYFIYEAE